MKTRMLVRILFLAAALTFAFAAHAQNAAQNTAQPSSKTHKQPPHKKTPAVWTDDNITSVRTPADNYVEKEEAEASLREISPKKTAASQAVPAQGVKHGQPPLLSNPKTPESANKMIAWEDRDFKAQTEFIVRLQKELEQAPPEDQARLQNLIQQRQQVVAEIQRERQALVGQKKQLEQKAANAGNGASSNSSN